MPFKSKKQETYLKINEPKIYKEWKERYGTFKSDTLDNKNEQSKYMAQDKTGYEIPTDDNGSFFMQIRGDKETIQKAFKDWKPKAYPYEKRITQDSLNITCENCGKENVHYQFYLPQKNSRNTRMRFVDGATYCKYDEGNCGANLCSDCADDNDCENCGAEMCSSCADESEYNDNHKICVPCREADEMDAETFEYEETIHEKGDYRIIAVEDYDVSTGGVFQERDDFDRMMELSDTYGMFTLSLQKKVMKPGWETIDSVAGVVPHYGDMEDVALTELNIPEGIVFEAPLRSANEMKEQAQQIVQKRYTKERVNEVADAMLEFISQGIDDASERGLTYYAPKENDLLQFCDMESKNWEDMKQYKMAFDLTVKRIRDAGYQVRVSKRNSQDYIWNIKWEAETFEAPYAGLGSLFGFGQDTGLGSFTTSELTGSSAIHGDFDSASLNYSGHQAVFARAENEMKNVEFEDWAKQEMKTHGKDVSFKNWAKKEEKSHGNVELIDWAEHEEESHDERYGEKMAENEDRQMRAEEPMVEEPDFIPDGDGRALGQQTSSINLSPLHAESRFDKLSKQIADEYEEKGESPEEAERIGDATAAKIGRMKYGKKGMENLAKKETEYITKTNLLIAGVVGIGLWKGKQILDMTMASLKRSAEEKRKGKACGSCNSQGSIRKTHTQVKNSEYSVDQVNPVEVQGQNDIHGAEGITNPRHSPSSEPFGYPSKSLKMW